MRYFNHFDCKVGLAQIISSSSTVTMSTEKAAIITASAPNPLEPTIFHEPWWLDISAEGNYSYVEAKENGLVVGRLPYFLKSRFGMKYSIMPPMTHFLGPAIVAREGNAPTRFLKRLNIIHELVDQLPPAAIYQYKCHWDITDTIAFQQKKFHSRVQFTFEVPPLPEDVLWSAMRSKKRKKIRAAQDDVKLCYITDPMEFWTFYNSNLETRDKENICHTNICIKLIESTLARGRGQIHAARDSQGNLTAAVFCIWDAYTSYYYMSTRSPASHGGVISLLTWEAMKDAAQRGLIFDFDGLSNSNGVLFFAEFGGTIKPRYIVTRHSALGGIALNAREIRRENRFFF